MIDLPTQTVPVDSPAVPGRRPVVAGENQRTVPDAVGKTYADPKGFACRFRDPDAAYGIVKLIRRLPKDSGHI
jgi:hypothetical protein